MFEYACDLEIAQNSNCLVSRDHMFFPEKSEQSQEKTRDHEKLNCSSFELFQNHMHIQTCDIGCFDDFLSYLRVPPYAFFSKLIKENSDTMLVISKMNMDAIRINASVHPLTKLSLVS